MSDRFTHSEMAEELDNLAPKREQHGMRLTPEYRSWAAMKTRCTNPRQRTYERYGAKGITVCARWRDSFLAFYEDMGPKPFPAATVDRIDNSKGYEPDNCRWASALVQSRNRERCHLEVEGVRKPLRRWAAEAGIHIATIRRRLNEGATPKEAVAPPMPRGERNHEYFRDRAKQRRHA